MILRDAIDGYIDWQRSHGARFEGGARLVHQFARNFPEGTCCDAESGSDVRPLPCRKRPAHPVAGQQQVQRSERVLPLRNQPRPCQPLAIAGGRERAEMADISPAPCVYARVTAAPFPDNRSLSCKGNQARR